MAIQLEKDLWQLDIPLAGNPLKNLNSYLITGERNLLIDTGFNDRCCREAMYSELKETGSSLDNTDIFLTHLHTDHSGLAPYLIKPGCNIYISEIDGKHLIKSYENEYWEKNNRLYISEGFPEDDVNAFWHNDRLLSMAPTHFTDYMYVHDGDELSYGGHTLRCIMTPGHTPGHMCLYEPDVHWFFAGDHIMFHITPNITRWDVLDDALGSYLDSLKAVRELPVNLLMPAHRKQTGNLRDRVDELTAHHMNRLEDARKALRKAGGSATAYQIAAGMKWSIHSRSWDDFPVIQKYFAVGEAMSHIDYLVIRGELIKHLHNGNYMYTFA